jgi:hypothetical protein
MTMGQAISEHAEKLERMDRARAAKTSGKKSYAADPKPVKKPKKGKK